MRKKLSIISGGAGFIGSNLVKFLQSENRHIVVMDNMCRGSKLFLEKNLDISRENITVIEGDCSDKVAVRNAFKFASQLGDIDEVWHLAANSDIPAGIANPNVDLRDTFLTTFVLLEEMRLNNVGVINFASSSAIYGDFGSLPINEDSGPLLPISNYGAMKLASEALISAATESYLVRANIFRFPNVVGIPATHGVILDFIKKLAANPALLKVLGDGTQQKSYLHVSDLIRAMLLVRARIFPNKIEVINIGPIDDGVTVRAIAEAVVSRINPSAKIHYGQGSKGWIGDVPKFNYSTKRLQSYGWKPQLNSVGAVNRAIDEIAAQFDQLLL